MTTKKPLQPTENPGGAGTGTKREILRSAECVYCGYMVPAPNETIPTELDNTARQTLRCGRPGASAPRCWTKGSRTVSLVDGRLQYTVTCQHDGHTFASQDGVWKCTRCGLMQY